MNFIRVIDYHKLDVIDQMLSQDWPSAWKNKDSESWEVATYGIRSTKIFKKTHVNSKLGVIDVEINGKLYPFTLSPSFVRKCPEIREIAENPIVGDLLKTLGLIPWPEDKPPKLELIPIPPPGIKLKINRFKLTRIVRFK